MRRVRRVIKSPTTIFGLFVVLLIVAAFVWPSGRLPHDPVFVDITNRLTPPFWSSESDSAHFLGTDQLGRDIFSRLVYSTRYTVTISILSVLIAAVIGVFAGLIAGYFGGKADVIIGRLIDVQLAFPTILLLLAVVAIIGSSMVNLILVIGISGWASFARVVRGSTLQMREYDFVHASLSLGATNARIIVRHIFPNIGAPIIVFATFEIARVMLLESGLSFLGLGVQPPSSSWGSMIGDGRGYLFEGGWVSAIPGVALVLAITATNFIGDGLRDLLDPKMSVQR